MVRGDVLVLQRVGAQVVEPFALLRLLEVHHVVPGPIAHRGEVAPAGDHVVPPVAGPRLLAAAFDQRFHRAPAHSGRSTSVAPGHLSSIPRRSSAVGTMSWFCTKASTVRPPPWPWGCRTSQFNCVLCAKRWSALLPNRPWSSNSVPWSLVSITTVSSSRPR